jgi:hypothetical protein
MTRRQKLSPSMTVAQFDNGYWYAVDLKAFADSIGIPSSMKLRKDELEAAIRLFLQTGKITSPAKRSLSSPGTKDTDGRLRLDLPVVVYTNNKETKSFLEREARKIAPGLKRRSGARYRLNRWREAQLHKGIPLTYADVVREYVRLSQTDTPFARIPTGRYINFMSDFLASEKAATRAQAIQAWKKLKAMDTPKTYQAWVRSRSS